ncbi:MAG: ATPase [Pseudomonadota bacterium]|nr:ATPase [Pseudomonadota bacterium]
MLGPYDTSSTVVRVTSHHAPAIRYIIGIDGGGTATRARLTRLDGEVLGCAHAGPSALAQGVEQAWNNVSEAIAGVFTDAELADWQPQECAIGLGLAGAIVAKYRREFLKLANRFGKIELASDGYTTLLGAHGGRPGAVVAAGTGSIGEALLPTGECVLVGGWGYPVGDDGGGAWLGMCAMREAQRASDGRAPAGLLVHAVRRVAGDSREALLAWCEGAGQHAYATLAPLVFASEATDTKARQLLDAAARALDDIALSLDPEGRLPLVVSGSIGQRLQGRLAPAIRSRLVEPVGDAVDGALTLIRRQLDATAKHLGDR